MKAILLVGGFGTRLRPLTFHTPKPMIPFANKPVLEHIISSLASVGVVEVVLAVGYKPDILHDFSQDMESRHNIKVTCVMETVPMGTGGAMKNCQEIIEKDNPSGLFFACNADIIASYPFQEMIDMMNDLRANEHTKDAEGIISLISVDDPTKYGVVLYDKTGKVTEFLEKPKNPPSNKINAGMYLLSTKIFERMDMKKTSIEVEVFPKMVADNRLYSTILKGIWMDIGQPHDYLTGLGMYLGSLPQNHEDLAVCEGTQIIGRVLIHPSAKVASSAVLGPNVTIGKDVVIGEGVRLKNCAIFERATIGDFSNLEDTIVSWDSQIGKWVRTFGITVIAERVTIKDESLLNGCKVLPDKDVKSFSFTPEIIM